MTNHEQARIQKTLKSLMKQRKMTYQSMGKALKVSPATVKRRLNGGDLSLQQLKELAECLSLSLYEIIDRSKRNQRVPHLFTEAQEKFLSSDLLTMNLFRMILAGQTFSEMKTHLKASDQQIRRIARGLEKFGLAKLMPGDQFVSIVQFPVRWQANGLLNKTYGRLILKNVVKRMERTGPAAGLHTQFELALSRETYEDFCREIQECYEKYRGLSELHLSSRIEWSSLVSGVLFIDQFSIWDPL